MAQQKGEGPPTEYLITHLEALEAKFVAAASSAAVESMLQRFQKELKTIPWFRQLEPKVAESMMKRLQAPGIHYRESLSLRGLLWLGAGVLAFYLFSIFVGRIPAAEGLIRQAWPVLFLPPIVIAYFVLREVIEGPPAP